MFASTTTTVTGAKAPRPFSWSYSKIKNFRVCPKKYYNVDVTKQFKEEDSEQLTYGNEVHEALAKRLMNARPLPKPLEHAERWIDLILKDCDRTKVVLKAEQKLAITKDFLPCEYFDKRLSPWFRTIADVVKLVPVPEAPTFKVGYAYDWKTGATKEDKLQLALVAAAVFAHYPDVRVVRSSFIWLKDDIETAIVVPRAKLPELWATILPEVQFLQHAHETTTFPAKPSGICKRWCPVTDCAHHGIGSTNY